jgi:hypothetical protein
VKISGVVSTAWSPPAAGSVSEEELLKASEEIMFVLESEPTLAKSNSTHAHADMVTDFASPFTSADSDVSVTALCGFSPLRNLGISTRRAVSLLDEPNENVAYTSSIDYFVTHG